MLIVNLITITIFVIFATIFINNTENKIIIISLTLLTNILIMLILYGFTISNSIYETVYQIKTDNQGYHTKLYRYILILFGIG